MRMNSMIYSFVARGTVVLAEYTAFSGSFSTIAVQCLQKLPANQSKFTYTYDRHTFNYFSEDRYTYLVVAEEDFGRQIPFALLDRVKNDFRQRYGGGRADTATSHGLDKDFGPRLKEHMAFAVEHPEEMNKLANIKSEVQEVKGIMLKNVDNVLDRGEKIEVLVLKTDNLRDQADNYHAGTRKLRRKLCIQNLKMKLCVLSIIIILLALITWLCFCKGIHCR